MQSFISNTPASPTSPTSVTSPTSPTSLTSVTSPTLPISVTSQTSPTSADSTLPTIATAAATGPPVRPPTIVKPLVIASGIVRPKGDYINIPTTLSITKEAFNGYKVCKIFILKMLPRPNLILY